MILLTLTLALGLSLPNEASRFSDSLARFDSTLASQPLLLPYRSEIGRHAREFKIPAALIAAVIQEESRFAPWATRTEPAYKKKPAVRRAAQRWSLAFRGAPTVQTELDDRSRSIGLMQVMGEVAREQGFNSQYLAALYEPGEAIHQGAMLLRRLIDRYHHDTLSAISAYNQGDNRRKNGFFLNARYVYRVSVAWQFYRRMLGE